MSVSKISTHLDDAIRRLLYQFQGKTGIESLIGAHAKQFQDIEDAGFDFMTKVPMQSATGAVLDRWGIVLDEARLGDNDADYRARLFFKISRNISNGTPEELIQFFSELVQAESVQIFEVFPGVVVLTAVNAQNPADPEVVRLQLQQLAPAGVRIGYLATGGDDHPFAFAAHPNPNARGFDTYPVEEIGGVFVSLF
jgi:hypothetical protein